MTHCLILAFSLYCMISRCVVCWFKRKIKVLTVKSMIIRKFSRFKKIKLKFIWEMLSCSTPFGWMISWARGSSIASVSVDSVTELHPWSWGLYIESVWGMCTHKYVGVCTCSHTWVSEADMRCVPHHALSFYLETGSPSELETCHFRLGWLAGNSQDLLPPSSSLIIMLGQQVFLTHGGCSPAPTCTFI